MPLKLEDIRREEIHDIAKQATRDLIEIEHVSFLALLCILAGKGHGGRDRPNSILLEGLNGLSKTEACKALNLALCGPALRAFYRVSKLDALVRVQCTPDQVREDLLGSDVLDAKRRPVFRPGPLLTPCLIALLDELNRAPPKAQAALFSAMAERVIPIAGTTLDEKYRGKALLPAGFHFIIATQNPDFQEGTYPLPEAQLDRFLAKVRVPYLTTLERLLERDERPPSDEEARENEKSLADDKKALDDAGGFQDGITVEARDELHKKLLNARAAWLGKLREEVRDRVKVQEKVLWQIRNYVYFTWSKAAVIELAPEIRDQIRQHDSEFDAVVAGVRQGVMPRGAQALRDLAKALRFVKTSKADLGSAGQVEVTSEDVDQVAKYVLAHRITLGAAAMVPSGDDEGSPPSQVAEAIVARIGVLLHDLRRRQEA